MGAIYLVFSLIIVGILSLTTTVPPNSEECFFENVDTENSKAKLQFQVASGGFLDIDVVVNDATGNLIHEFKRKSEGKVTFDINPPFFQVCFSNKMSSLTPKAVQFTIDIGDIMDPNLASTENIDPIEKAIMRVSEGLKSIQKQQQYLRTREAIHRDLIEKTNTRVMIWSFLQLGILVGMTFWQIYYLKRLFGRRRAV